MTLSHKAVRPDHASSQIVHSRAPRRAVFRSQTAGSHASVASEVLRHETEVVRALAFALPVSILLWVPLIVGTAYLL
jgi:hypothetical protein